MNSFFIYILFNSVTKKL